MYYKDIKISVHCTLDLLM